MNVTTADCWLLSGNINRIVGVCDVMMRGVVICGMFMFYILALGYWLLAIGPCTPKNNSFY